MLRRCPLDVRDRAARQTVGNEGARMSAFFRSGHAAPIRFAATPAAMTGLGDPVKTGRCGERK
jgi:hypothetical protein